MSWRLVYTKQAQKDAAKLAAAGLKAKAEELLAVLRENPCFNFRVDKRKSRLPTQKCL